MWCVYTTEYYSAVRRDEILPFATTWIDLEIITLSEISHIEKVENHTMSLYVDYKPKSNKQDKQRLVDMDNRLTSGYQRVWGRGHEGGRWSKRGQICSDRKKSLGSEHTVQYIYALLLNCTPETYWILLTSVTIKKKIKLYRK